MSASKKKVMQPMEEDTDDSTSSDEENGKHPEAYTGNEEIQVDFEGRNPIDTDIYGISQLLHQLFLKAHINISEMAEMIIDQNYIGSVVIQSELDEEEDDDDDDSNMVFGITTAINMMSKKDIKCIEELRTYILDRAEKNATEEICRQFKDILSDDGRPVGFFINERFINIPPQISVPLMENLYKEIKRANDKKMPYNFSFYLMIIKFYRKKAKKNKPEEDFYSNPEEEMIAKEAYQSFEFSVDTEADTGMSGDWLEGDSTMKPYRKVVLFEANKFSDVILNIKGFINE